MRVPSILAAFLLTMTASANNDLSLPDPLTTIAGERVTSTAEWSNVRRAEILELFQEHVFGRSPVGRPDNLRFEVVETEPAAMDGMATLKRVAIHFTGPGGAGAFKVSIFIPNNAPRPAPGFLFIANREREHIDPSRQIQSPFWPAEQIVQRGYVAAAFHNADVAPDNHDDGFASGVFSVLEPEYTPRQPDAWGTIAAWAWGASRVMDYFESDPDIDEKHIAVVGHSRGGKAALWCGAEDERFALVISNNSGCTGAALARRKIGESVATINRNFPHWFCGNYKAFNDKEDELPVDQHQLIALMAPRLVYIASATEDGWADPEGEFLSAVHAGPVYQLFNLQGLGTNTFPNPEQPIHSGQIGYHLRTGKHDLTPYDWNQFMNFADQHWQQQ